MDIYTREFIDGSLKQIPKQNNNSKYLTLFPFTKYHSIFLDFEVIEFPENSCCYLIPLNNIFGTILTNVVATIRQRGYDPINQLMGYIKTGDPIYIPRDNHAREQIRLIEIDDIFYFNNYLFLINKKLN